VPLKISDSLMDHELLAYFDFFVDQNCFYEPIIDESDESVKSNKRQEHGRGRGGRGKK
jgi:hypothetical protein